MQERIEELERILTINCVVYEDDCTTCPYAKECEEYSKLYQEVER